ncbi:MAG TPA: DUF433 domain-containing protein [Micropepsaceae bacterium]|nr:DUF433 domain-containing protein [Micropepsaceae bacterium]
MSQDQKLLERITVDPAILGGKPCIRGMRISVEQIVRWFASGGSEAELTSQFPFLERDDVRAALLYASRVSSITRMSGEALNRAAALDDAAAR